MDKPKLCNVDVQREFYAKTVIPGNGTENGWFYIRSFNVPREWNSTLAGQMVLNIELTSGGYGYDGEGSLTLEKAKELRDWLTARIDEQEKAK
jgi:hypothetical protein